MKNLESYKAKIKEILEALKEQFRIMEFEGVKVIPFGEPCEGFSYQTGCSGHEVIDAD